MQEKLHKITIQSKIDDTKEHMRKVANKLENERKEKAKAEKAGIGASSYSMPSYSETMGVAVDDYETKPSLRMTTSETKSSSSSKKKGLQLGKGRKQKDLLESLIAEGESVDTELDISKSTAGPSSKPLRPASEQVSFS